MRREAVAATRCEGIGVAVFPTTQGQRRVGAGVFCSSLSCFGFGERAGA